MYGRSTFELPYLGRLRLQNVYACYDIPVLFSCESLAGQRFLALWVDHAEGTDRWLLLPVSRERLQQIESGCISLRNALLTAESALWEAKFDLATATGAVVLIASEEIAEEDLPSEDSLLSEIWEPEGEPEPTYPTAQDEATRRLSDILDVRLVGEEKGKKVPTLAAGAILSGLQRLADAVEYAFEGERGTIPKTITKRTELRVLAAYPGSLVIRLVSAADPTLFGGSGATRSLKWILRLVACKDDSTQLTEVFNEIGPRAMSHWKGMAKKVGEYLNQMDLEWASPDGQTGSVSIAQEEAMSTYRLLHKWRSETAETIQMAGNLIGVDAESRLFHFNAEDGSVLRGKLAVALSESSLLVNREGTATFEVGYQTSDATEQEKKEYSLVSWSPSPQTELAQ